MSNVSVKFTAEPSTTTITTASHSLPGTPAPSTQHPPPGIITAPPPGPPDPPNSSAKAHTTYTAHAHQTRSPSSPSSPIVINFNRRPSRTDPPADDPERQPLISPHQTRRGTLPIVLAILAVLILGTMIGIGGWRLGKGEGAGKWPGGPVAPPKHEGE